MNTLSKTRTVMHFVRQHDDHPALYERGKDEPGERDMALSLDVDVWREMDKPETITVTVEPGDLLND